MNKQGFLKLGQPVQKFSQGNINTTKCQYMTFRKKTHKSKDFIQFFFFFNDKTLATPHKVRFLNKGIFIADFYPEDNKKIYFPMERKKWD